VVIGRSLDAIEEALGEDAGRILLSALRSSLLRARVPLYQLAMLRHMAQQESSTVSAVLTRELEDMACAHADGSRLRFQASARRLRGPSAATRRRHAENQASRGGMNTSAPTRAYRHRQECLCHTAILMWSRHSCLRPYGFKPRRAWMDVSHRGMQSTADRIQSPRDGINAMPHGVNLTWRTVHSIPARMHSTPDGMPVIRDRLNAIAGHVNLVQRDSESDPRSISLSRATNA